MRILRHTREAPSEARGAVVALGNFDGVHLGHRALIGEARRIAREKNAPLAALVFEPYPREFFRPGGEPFRLTTLRTKAHLLEQAGVDWLFVAHFDAGLAAMPAQDFVLGVLVKELGAAHVVVGRDFRFGKGRGGDASVLAYMGEMEGFGVTVFEPVVTVEGTKISSTDIRNALKNGDPYQAGRLLGHWWSIEGHVAHGDKRGRELGFPTANLKLEQVIHPAFGIYAVRVAIPARGPAHYGGAASFGIRPMFELEQPLLEAHLFDFSGDLYGEIANIEFIGFLRGEQKFDGLEALKKQIAEDCARAKRILADAPYGGPS